MLTYLNYKSEKTICINTQKDTFQGRCLLLIYSYILIFLCFYFSITDSSSCVPSGKKAFTINLFGVTVIVI